MVDIADLKARVLAARQFTVTVGPADAARTISMLEPTDHEVRLASLRAGIARGEDQAASVLFERALVAMSIKGWSGVTAADLVASQPEQAAKLGAELVQFDPEGVELLLDNQRAWSQQLWAALVDRLDRRTTTRQAAAKN